MNSVAVLVRSSNVCIVISLHNQHNDTQHNDTQHNDTQHEDIEHKDIQHNNEQNFTLSIITFSKMVEHCYPECHIHALYAECQYFHVVMLSVVMSSVVAPPNVSSSYFTMK